MADPDAKAIASKLLETGFSREGPAAAALSDPVSDTPMVLTLDQLRPYDHDPRVARNPAYEDIKASIRERGLDAPPPVTRRPGEAHFMVRNGGNTRLKILRELWTETRDERFFRLHCLYRPWPARGEIVALTGHLAENELRGGLSFVERALAVEYAQQLYQQESGRSSMSQSELARRLSADGYPIQQSHISRMRDAVLHLLPAIPTVLYAGLGRHQVERLSVLRKAAERAWERHADRHRATGSFADFFVDVLAPFDADVAAFSTARVEDELIGQMAELFGLNYDALALDFDESQGQQQALLSPPSPDPASSPQPEAHGASASAPREAAPAPSPSLEGAPASARLVEPPSAPDGEPIVSLAGAASEPGAHPDASISEHIVSPAASTPRLLSIQRLVAEQLGDATAPAFPDQVLQYIPLQAGGLYPITDIWYVEPSLETADALRVHIAQFAREIASEVDLGEFVESASRGIGYACVKPVSLSSPQAQAVYALLDALADSTAMDPNTLRGVLPALLHGLAEADPPVQRLSDAALVKLFRLLRLARKLQDLDRASRPDDV